MKTTFFAKLFIVFIAASLVCIIYLLADALL